MNFFESLTKEFYIEQLGELFWCTYDIARKERGENIKMREHPHDATTMCRTQLLVLYDYMIWFEMNLYNIYLGKSLKSNVDQLVNLEWN